MTVLYISIMSHSHPYFIAYSSLLCTFRRSPFFFSIFYPFFLAFPPVFFWFLVFCAIYLPAFCWCFFCSCVLFLNFPLAFLMAAKRWSEICFRILFASWAELSSGSELLSSAAFSTASPWRILTQALEFLYLLNVLFPKCDSVCVCVCSILYTGHKTQRT